MISFLIDAFDAFWTVPDGKTLVSFNSENSMMALHKIDLRVEELNPCQLHGTHLKL